MLTARQNMDEVIRCGNPDRFCNNYEAVMMLMNPFVLHNPSPKKGGPNVVNAWGITRSFPGNTPGAFPVHTPDKIVIKDYEEWQEYVHAPSLDFTDAEWEIFRKQYDAIDRTQAYATTTIIPGLFEQMHHLGGIENALMAFYECPDEVHDLIKYLTDWELELAETVCANLTPDAILHHDDWGSMKSTFMSVDMFNEFFLDSYKQIYKYYHDHGCKYVIHHSDSYGATLVPSMIEMGIDVWQGCMSSNDIPSLVKKYGKQITFMGGLDGAMVDREDATPEMIKDTVYRVLDEVGTPNGFIPCVAQGGPGSVYPGVYQSVIDAVDQYNIEKMGVKKEDITRLPLQILFG